MNWCRILSWSNFLLEKENQDLKLSWWVRNPAMLATEFELGSGKLEVSLSFKNKRLRGTGIGLVQRMHAYLGIAYKPKMGKKDS